MANNEVERSYIDRTIFPKSGNRIVHLILRDNIGNSIVAAAGQEKSRRHMDYSISQDFLRVFGSTSTANAQTKWKARQGVTEWLESLKSERRPIFTDPSQKLFETEHSVEYIMSMMARFSNRLSPPAEEGSSNSQPHNSGIVWSGNACICDKQLKHYPAFCRSGTTIPVCSFVFFMSKVGTDYLGYVEDMYEDRKGNKLVRVRRFHFLEEMKKRKSDLEADSNEVFITSDEKVIGAERVDGLATVLSPIHYEQCLTYLPRVLSIGSFVCHRIYKNNEIKPFRMSGLFGYPTQPIFSSVPLVTAGHDLNPNHIRLKIKLPSNVPASTKSVVHEPRGQVSFKVNDNIEVLSQDSGLRGCWFRCKILHCSEKILKVKHYDVLDVDGPEKLEEKIPSTKVANPDKLGMRCAGRLTIRPWPCKDHSDVAFGIGAAVDAWKDDGWWEGVVTGSHTSKDSTLQVYFPGENKYSTVKRKNLRVSRDWVGDKWIDIKAKPDILSFLSSTFNPTRIIPPVPKFNEATSTSTALAKGENSLRKEGCSSMSAEIKALEKLYSKKGQLSKNNKNVAARNARHAGNDDTGNSSKPLKINSTTPKTKPKTKGKTVNQ